MSASYSLTDVRPQLSGFSPYVAGRSIEEIKKVYGLDTVIKLASNENPLGAPPVVQRTIEGEAGRVFRYARAGNPELSAAIGARLGVDPARVVTGNGSDEIIDLLIRIKPVPGQQHIVAFRPCFSMYEVQARFAGVEFRQVDLPADLTPDLDALAEATDADTALVFLTSPDNPSGHACTVEEIASLAGRVAERAPGALLVVDEAYIEFVDDVSAHSPIGLLDELPNVALLRTFSKVYGLAGLRLGYGVVPVWLAEHLRAVRMPFSVNVLAEAAGLAALADDAFLAATLTCVREGREYLMRELSALGCTPRPSCANFILFVPPKEPAEVFEALLSRGIIIRPLASYGLAHAMRVSVGTMDENRAFITELDAILNT